MDIDPVNQVFDRESPENLIVQTYDARSRDLVLAFTCDGGPKEDEAYVVRFEETILFHLPSYLYLQVRLRRATETEREQLIPAESYDSHEIGGADGAYTVVLLVDQYDKAIGYYVAAKSVSAEWLPHESCLATV